MRKHSEKGNTMTSIHPIGRSHRAVLSLALVLMVLSGSIVLGPAVAQKSKKSQPVATSQGTIKELVKKYQGQMTNIGTITKVEGDYFVVEDEGVTAMYPIGAIQAIRLVKVEEEEEGKDSTHIEIRLMAHD
jgi:hypothetical protein